MNYNIGKLIIISLLVIYQANAQEIDKRSDNDNRIICGETQTIIWNSSDWRFPDNVDIFLWNGDTGSETLIVSGIPGAKGEYLWTVPQGQPTGNHFRIKIKESDGLKKKDYPGKAYSKSFFKIYPYDTERIYDSDNNRPNLSLDISPNPVGSKLEIECSDKMLTVQVYDIAGKMLHEARSVDNKYYTLNTGNFAIGTYYIRVIAFKGDILNEKFVLQK